MSVLITFWEDVKWSLDFLKGIKLPSCFGLRQMNKYVRMSWYLGHKIQRDAALFWQLVQSLWTGYDILYFRFMAINLMPQRSLSLAVSLSQLVSILSHEYLKKEAKCAHTHTHTHTHTQSQIQAQY